MIHSILLYQRFIIDGLLIFYRWIGLWGLENQIFPYRYRRQKTNSYESYKIYISTYFQHALECITVIKTFQLNIRLWNGPLTPSHVYLLNKYVVYYLNTCCFVTFWSTLYKNTWLSILRVLRYIFKGHIPFSRYFVVRYSLNLISLRFSHDHPKFGFVCVVK